MNNLTDILKSERIARREGVRAKLGNIIAAAQAYHTRPDDLDLKLWLLEEFYTFLGADDLSAEIDELRHQTSECEDCHQVNCICDYPYEERVSGAGYGVGL